MAGLLLIRSTQIYGVLFETCKNLPDPLAAGIHG